MERELDKGRNDKDEKERLFVVYIWNLDCIYVRDAYNLYTVYTLVRISAFVWRFCSDLGLYTSPSSIQCCSSGLPFLLKSQ